MQVEDVALSRLKPAPWNPRLIRDVRFKSLCASVQADPEFLYRRPVLAMADGTIYAGNMRYRAAEHLKLPTVPAVVEDISEQLAKERALRDNQQWGEWNEDELAEMLYELKVSDRDIENLGFDEKELARLLASVGMGDGLTDDDAVPEAPEDPVTKPDDLWLLGDHRVLCGDSTKATDVARVMGHDMAACMWTDPPYGVAIVGGNRRLSEKERMVVRPESATIRNDERDSTLPLLVDAFTQADAVLERGAPWYVARPAGAQQFAFADAIRTVAWRLHEDLQWVKGTMVLGHSDYHLRHETIMYGWTPGEGRSGRGDHEGSRWYGDNGQNSVIEIPLQHSPDHPTMKPVELIARHVGNSTPVGGRVYDPFLGSGTTLIACEKLGRRCYGLEIEPRYVDVIVKRWEDYTGKKAVLDGEQAPEASLAAS